MKPSNRQDTYRHQGLRNQLIRSIQKKGICDPAILSAMEKVPRHFFFDSSFLEYAYEDQPFPIGAGQTISQPFTVAFQSTLLNISKGDKVLEIGTGSGYQACILAELGAKVFSIERQKTLYDKTRSLLSDMGYQRIKLFYGDGYKGLPSFAPFDRVLVTAAAPYIPEPLIQQLKPGGILVIPVGEDVQIMTTIHKISETETRKQEHGNFRFVPMLEDKAKGQ
ncbi:MAG: protein-L-isoaspartate(D-aspartate) O-methyltransferase [Bacteroidota bacterium]